MHFLIFQFAGNLFLAIIMNVSGGGIEIYNENRILLTGLAGFFVMPFSLYFYKRDHARRMAGGLLPGTGENHLSFWDGILLLVLGAGAAAFLMWPEQSFLKKTDEETVEAVSAQAAAVKKGSLPQNVEGRGRLEYGEAESISLPSGCFA